MAKKPKPPARLLGPLLGTKPSTNGREAFIPQYQYLTLTFAMGLVVGYVLAFLFHR